jgi:hypothetical protein
MLQVINIYNKIIKLLVITYVIFYFITQGKNKLILLVYNNNHIHDNDTNRY